MGPMSVTRVVPTYTSSATSASSASGTCGGTATVATPSTSRPSATGRYAADSTHGPGTAWRPNASKARHTSTGVASVASIVTPSSASRAHSFSPGSWSPSAQARAALTVSAPASSPSSAAAKSRWSPVSSNLIGATSRGSPRIRSATMLRCTSLVPA